MSPRIRFALARRFGASLAVAAAVGAAVLGTTACASLTPDGPQNEPEDDNARKAHFEEAAQTYYDGGKYQQAVIQWRKVLAIEPERPKANWGLAKSLAMMGTVQSLRESEAIFVKIDGWDWNHPTLGDRRHEVLKDHAEVYLQLADYYDRDVTVLESQLDDPGADVPSIRRHMQEQIAKRNELLSKAIPLYERVLELSPDNPHAIAGLAKAHLTVGNNQRGIAFSRRYLALTRSSQEGWNRELKALEDNRGRTATDEQREYYRAKIRSAREKEIKMHLLLASVLIRMKDYRGSVAEYDVVLEMDPVRPAARVERAQALAGTGDYKKAIDDLEEYLKITDPVKQRGSRMKAAELLEQYRLAALGVSSSRRSGPGPTPGPTTGPAFPPPPPPPAPIMPPSR